MAKQLFWPRLKAAWPVSLMLLAILALAACGGATGSVAEDTPAAAATETEAPADTPTAARQDTPTAAAETPAEPAATQEADVAQPSPTSSTAECVPVDVPDNDLIAAVTGKDWVDGSADAPVTLIEYGDFQ